MKKSDIDPLEYIENAFLDNKDVKDGEGMNGQKNGSATKSVAEGDGEALKSTGIQGNGEDKRGQRFRKTELSAPRPRRAKRDSDSAPIDPELQAVWEALPKNIEFLMGFFDDSVTGNYYRGEFKETREELIRRLLDPELSLEETSRLLGVCPATVRRYTNRDWLTHHRTQGGQRRFRLSDVVKFVEKHGRFPEE